VEWLDRAGIFLWVGLAEALPMTVEASRSTPVNAAVQAVSDFSDSVFKKQLHGPGSSFPPRGGL